MLNLLNSLIALFAFGLSIFVYLLSRRRRQADSFAKLYDEYNTPSFGAHMECIGKWAYELSREKEKDINELSESDIRFKYREHLEALSRAGKNTKDDSLESARRTVKAWFIKCLLYSEARDLSGKHLRALITCDRAAMMFRVFAMTREQTDVWKRLPHVSTSRNSSDEPYFVRLERIAGQKRSPYGISDMTLQHGFRRIVIVLSVFVLSAALVLDWISWFHRPTFGLAAVDWFLMQWSTLLLHSYTAFGATIVLIMWAVFYAVCWIVRGFRL